MSTVTNIHILKSDLFYYPVNMTVLCRCRSSSSVPPAVWVIPRHIHDDGDDAGGGGGAAEH